SPLPLVIERRFAFCGTDPWGRPPWPLASTLPCGARTFLPRGLPRARDRPAFSGAIKERAEQKKDSTGPRSRSGAERLESRQEIAEQNACLEWKHRVRQRAGCERACPRHGDQEVRGADPVELAELVREIFRRPVADDLEGDLGAVGVREHEIGHEE